MKCNVFNNFVVYAFLSFTLVSCNENSDFFRKNIQNFNYEEHISPDLFCNLSYYLRNEETPFYFGYVEKKYGIGCLCSLIQDLEFNGNCKAVFLRNDVFNVVRNYQYTEEEFKSIKNYEGFFDYSIIDGIFFHLFLKSNGKINSSECKIVDTKYDKVSNLSFKNYTLVSCFKENSFEILKDLNTGSNINRKIKRYENFTFNKNERISYNQLNSGGKFSIIYFPNDYEEEYVFLPYYNSFKIDAKTLRVDEINNKLYLYLKRYSNTLSLGESIDMLIYDKDSLHPTSSIVPFYPFEEEFLDAYVEEFGCDPDNPSYCWFDLEKLEKIFRKDTNY